MDLRVLDQGVWWVDVTGQPHRLTEMSTEYLDAVIAFVTEHRDRGSTATR